MRKITLPALALAALIVTSCAKEKDGYDKNLTSDTWNLSSATITNETITKRDYSDGTDDQTETSRSTITLASGVQTAENYNLLQEVGSQDQFNRTIDKSNFTATYKFEKEGTFTSSNSIQATSNSVESTGVPIVTTTVTTQPVESTGEGIWSWQNTGDQKSQLTFDLGTFQVESISKTELVLKLNTSSSETSQPNSSLTETETETRSMQITMTR